VLGGRSRQRLGLRNRKRLGTRLFQRKVTAAAMPIDRALAGGVK
jgi:hypothetical protein